jgi:TolA-binding protein
MRRLASLAPIMLLTVTGCLASKSDIRLLQDEMRASRAQAAAGDTTILRADDARRAQIDRLSATITRMNDSLRILSGRLASFQATVNGEMDAMARQLVQFQALLGQNTRNVQEARARMDALLEQANANGGVAPNAGVVAPAGADSAQRASGTPGPATLFTSAVEELQKGGYRTARDGFDLLLTTYPGYNQAPLAQLHVGEAYAGLGNTAAADSVYQLVATRYPKSPEAATGLYRHGRSLWDSNRTEARRVLNRVIQEYPSSDEADLARNLLKGR